MPHNRLRALLNAGEPSVGTRLPSSGPTLVELIGNAGIALMIEKQEGVGDLDEVLSIKGIDVVRFGSCIGRDVGILHEWCQVNGEDIRGMLAGPPSAAGPKHTVSTCEARQ